MRRARDTAETLAVIRAVHFAKPKHAAKAARRALKRVRKARRLLAAG